MNHDAVKHLDQIMQEENNQPNDVEAAREEATKRMAGVEEEEQTTQSQRSQ